MVKLTTKALIPRGVVFLYDPTMIIDVPTDTSLAPVLHTKNCVSLWTIQDDEGSVSLSFLHEKGAIEIEQVFDGLIDTPGRRIAFNNSDVIPVLQYDVPNIQTSITIFTNDPFYPDEVICIISA